MDGRDGLRERPTKPASGGIEGFFRHRRTWSRHLFKRHHDSVLCDASVSVLQAGEYKPTSVQGKAGETLIRILLEALFDVAKISTRLPLLTASDAKSSPARALAGTGGCTVTAGCRLRLRR